jgi:hypothetical protein
LLGEAAIYLLSARRVKNGSFSIKSQGWLDRRWYVFDSNGWVGKRAVAERPERLEF